MSTEVEPIRLIPVLIHAPVFWLKHYWSESTHQWDEIRPSTPLAARPFAEIDAGLDATLGDILVAACDALQILPGPDMGDASKRRQELYRFAFVEEEADKDGIDSGVVYAWPSRLPVPISDGTISEVPGKEVTVRQLLAASELGLIRGDVRRPYLFPVTPQGAGQVVVELAKIAPEIVRSILTAVKGQEGELIRVVRTFPADLRHANSYVSANPIQSGAAVLASKGLWKMFRKRRVGGDS